jgi:hypothetical protein
MYVLSIVGRHETAVGRLDVVEAQVTSIVRVGAGLVGAEAVALLVFAVVAAMNINADRLTLGITNAVFFVIYAAALGLCAVGFARLSSWCRGPIVLTQIIQLGIAYSFASRATAWLSAALAVPALIVLASALAPSTTRALYGGENDDGPA